MKENFLKEGEKNKANKNKNSISKRANDLDGKTWLKYSISIWNDISKSKEELKLNHPALFPKELPKRLIKIFLPSGVHKVLDPFLGVGSTLIATKELGKMGIGFEISEEYVEIAKRRVISELSLIFNNGIPQEIYKDDANNMLKYLKENSIDLCITSPPYWDILAEKRSADQKKIKNYKTKENNLGEIHDYEMFLRRLKEVFEKVFYVLKHKSYCIVVVMDIRKKDEYYPFHMDVSNFMREIGFKFDDIIIWDRSKEYNNLKPLGYPSVFRINKIHEYILIFLKP